MATPPRKKLEASTVRFSPAGAHVVWEGNVDFRRRGPDTVFVLSTTAASCEWASTAPEDPTVTFHWPHCHRARPEVSGFEGGIVFVLNGQFFRFSGMKMRMGHDKWKDRVNKAVDNVPKSTFQNSFSYRLGTRYFRLEVEFARSQENGVASPHFFAFVCGRKRIRVACSKVRAAARSDVLRAQFSGGRWDDAISVEEEAGPAVVERFVHFLHTGELRCHHPRVRANLLLPLLGLADKYVVPRLLDLVQATLIAWMSKENVAELFAESIKRASCGLLKKIAFEFIVENRVAVATTEAWRRMRVEHPELPWESLESTKGKGEDPDAAGADK